MFPFNLFKGVPSKPDNANQNKPDKKTYSDPINKALDRFENSPKDMDLEDLFWIDEILGDD